MKKRAMKIGDTIVQQAFIPPFLALEVKQAKGILKRWFLILRISFTPFPLTHSYR